MLRRAFLRAAAVLVGTCVDFDLVADVAEERHLQFEAGVDLRGLENLARRRVALDSRLRNFIFTTAELRPDLLYSAFCTTMASLPIITTLPTRSSCAVFISKTVLWFLSSNARFDAGASKNLDGVQP